MYFLIALFILHAFYIFIFVPILFSFQGRFFIFILISMQQVITWPWSYAILTFGHMEEQLSIHCMSCGRGCLEALKSFETWLYIKHYALAEFNVSLVVFFFFQLAEICS